MPVLSKATTRLPVHEAERSEGNSCMKYSPDFIPLHTCNLLLHLTHISEKGSQIINKQLNNAMNSKSNQIKAF
jgi:hypothetical protein